MRKRNGSEQRRDQPYPHGHGRRCLHKSLANSSTPKPSSQTSAKSFDTRRNQANSICNRPFASRGQPTLSTLRRPPPEGGRPPPQGLCHDLRGPRLDGGVRPLSTVKMRSTPYLGALWH